MLDESSPPVCHTMSCRSPMPAVDRSSSVVTWSFHDTPIMSSSVEHTEHPVCLVSYNYASVRTMLQQNLHVLNRWCRLTQVVLYIMAVKQWQVC